MASFKCFLRKRNGTKSWYARFRDPKTGVFPDSYVSITKLRDTMHPEQNWPITSKKEAERIAEDAIKRGLACKAKCSVFIADYLKTFWDYDKSEYLAMCRQRKIKTVSRSTAKKNASMILKHIVTSDTNPKDADGNVVGYYLDDKLKASDLTYDHLDKLIESLIDTKGLEEKTVKNILLAVRKPIKELIRTGVITEDPFTRAQLPSTEARSTSRRIFTEAEFEKFCSYCLDNLGNLNGELWDKHAFCMLFGAATGMRVSEIRALRWEDITIPEDSELAYVFVRHSFDDRGDGLKGTKTGKSRVTFCPKVLVDFMLSYLGKTDGFIFSGIKGPESVMGLAPIGKRFSSILDALGIEKVTEDGELSFHSLRHRASTIIRAKAGKDVEQVVLGHDVDEKASIMTARYSEHFNEDVAKLYADRVPCLLPAAVIDKLCKLTALPDEASEDEGKKLPA